MPEPSLPLLLSFIGYGAGLWALRILLDIVTRTLNFRGKKLTTILLLGISITATIGMLALAQRDIACFPGCFPRTYPLVMMPVSLSLLRWSDQNSAEKHLIRKSNRLRFVATASLPILFIGMPADLLVVLTAYLVLRSVQDMALKVYRAWKHRYVAESTA